MESPIRTCYSSETISVENATGRLPKNCLFPISYADAELTRLSAGTVVRQYVSNYHFYMEMYDLNLHIPLILSYTVEHPTMFLFGMLKGVVKFTTVNGQIITETNENTCYAATNKPGQYLSHFFTGSHCLLYIVFKEDWLKRSPERYPLLIDFLQKIETDDLLYAFMPQCPITGHIKETFYNLCKPTIIEKEIFEDIQAIRCKYLLIAYHAALIYKSNLPAYRVKDFLDANYGNSELSNEKLADEFNTTKKTLIRTFKTEFGISPYAYLINVRMKQAMQLFNNNVSVSMTYQQVGYADSRSFSKQFKIFFGYPPSEYQ
ncbi:helix-turn-helix domain-containing protein [Pedobacter cryoconitis]|uniref:AraC-like DNA-binding protein n=1 Tax=Pedobacter cryoconitis TaxID=188932 RepID=A0A327TA91_9SPHI|nr:AraC family transcriptional regulator [Pedobacter cryoconitis]RAJ37325.1 AraC-like DNA-binding protein [Pedobacter cryoconitis]